MKAKPGIVLIAVSALLGALFLTISSTRDLTGLENTLMQLITFGLGLYGSYIQGKESMRESAKEIIKPHAKSAFRRLASLYESLSKLAYAVRDSKQIMRENQLALLVLERMDGIIDGQISTADDALEDWRDIIPEELEVLDKRLRLVRMKREKADG
jgi:hypothetical protein